MLFHVDMIYLAKQAKRGVEKALQMRTVTKSNPEGDFFSKLRASAFYTWHVHNSSYPSFARKKSNRSCSIKVYAKVFRRSRAFAAVVTSRSSSFEYTMSVHAVHAGAERNVCNIVVSTETHQTKSNPSPYRAA